MDKEEIDALLREMVIEEQGGKVAARFNRELSAQELAAVSEHFHGPVRVVYSVDLKWELIA